MKNLSVKYSKKLLDYAKQSAKDIFKTAWKRSKTTDDFIGNKFPDKFTEVAKTSPRNTPRRISKCNIKKISLLGNKPNHICKIR